MPRAFWVVLTLGAVANAHAAPQPKQPDLPKVGTLIVEQTNAFRRSERRESVVPNGKLTQTAQYFANYLAEHDNLSHTADGNEPAERAKKHGYEYCIVAENIAYEFNSAGFSTDELAKTFVQGWEHSPEHRKNMVDPDVTETGVAVARSGKTGRFYAVQMFGRPKSKEMTFRIENRTSDTIEYTVADQTFSLPTRYIRTHKLCRPSQVKFEWPGKTSTTITPTNSDEFRIVKRDGVFEVQKK